MVVLRDSERLDRTVVLVHDSGRGWDPVKLMAGLLAEHLQARYVAVPWTGEPGKLAKLRGYLPRILPSSRDVVLIACAPGHLQWALGQGLRRPRYGRLSAWVIDSFWPERIPHLARRGAFDRLFITDGELVGQWADATGTPTTFLPFGSDVLGEGSASGVRRTDLLRVGRQPVAWDDDEALSGAAARSGLRADGRIPFHEDPLANQRAVMAAMAASKFTLSFNNVASPAAYTHPSRQYLTGRWLDALASGAVVASAVPQCQASDEVLWPEATLELPTDDMAAGLGLLRGGR